MPAAPSRDFRTVFSLVEEATHLLRRAPASAWLTCYLGGAPFVVYLFFFWSDMSRSALASQRLMESALVLALLYVVMKVGQALFCDQLMNLIQGRDEPPDRMPMRGWLRLVASQAWIHATMPWVMTLAGAAVLPTAWVYASYHNITAMAVDHFRRGGRTHTLVNKSVTQSHHQPLQNHALMIVILIVSILVYLNLFVLLVLTTQLAKSFTGVENVFTMHPMLYASTSLQAFLIAASYLVMTPLVKSFYVLRCFYGAARKNGADLEVRLRTLQKKSVAAVATLCLLAMTLCQAGAETPQAAPAGRGEELNQSIRDVLKSSEYQWRLPRDATAGEAEESWFSSIVRGVAQWFVESASAVGRFIGDVIDWLFGGKEGTFDGEPGSENPMWLLVLPKLLLVLVGLLVLGMCCLLYRNWRQSQATEEVAAPAAAPEINLESEHVVASQLPENEWLKLAREKAAAGELRLALRALFLATLAHLGERKLLSITRSKSNGDYVRELGRRARERKALSEGFNEQVRTFDRVWYGWHEVNAELMESFEQQHQRITSHAS